MKRLFLIAYFFEVGFVLMVVPWSAYWDRNYFAEALPLIKTIITDNFVRGAVSGLGVINVSAGITELVSLMLSRNERPTPIVPSHFAED